jgi:hypothetical protein
MDELLEFKKNAILGKISGQPLCEEYRASLRKCGNNKELLVRLALMQQCIPYLSHACYEKIGLSKKYILENFGEYINGKKVFDDVEGVSGYTYSLYVGFEDVFSVSTDILACMWCNCPQLTIEASKCPVLYISNYSDIHLCLDGYNSPRIYLFDESKIIIDDADDTCDIIVYKYSNKAEVELGKYCLGNVKIFNKQLKL